MGGWTTVVIGLGKEGSNMKCKIFNYTTGQKVVELELGCIPRQNDLINYGFNIYQVIRTEWKIPANGDTPHVNILASRQA